MSALVLYIPPWRIRKPVSCACGCPRKMSNRSDDGMPRFATPQCSLAWYRQHDPKKIITQNSGLRN